MNEHTCDLTRRQFVKGLGATVAVAMAGGYGVSIWSRNPVLAEAAPPPLTFGAPVPGRTLLIIEMGGGNDGLNMVVPHADPAYFDLRRELAVSGAIDLDGEAGLHPALATVTARYLAGDVAIVEGIGYPEPDLSHFASMSTWWSGRPGAVGSTGWLGRYLDGTVGVTDPLAAITVGPGPSAAMVGDASFVVSIQDATGLAPAVPPWIDDVDELVASWAGFAAAPVDSPGLFGQVQRAIDATAAARTRLGAALQSPSGTRRGGRRGSITESLDVAARIVASDLSPAVIYVHGFGDFDTHQGQANRHDNLMTELDAALAAFLAAVDTAGAADDVLVMTTSEFGRRAATNGSGTDHGTAASHLLVGGPVRGGRYGEPPDLGRLDQRGNLAHTVDFRSLYASVLDGWLGIGHEDVLGARFETLPLLAPAASAPRRPAGRHVLI